MPLKVKNIKDDKNVPFNSSKSPQQQQQRRVKMEEKTDDKNTFLVRKSGVIKLKKEMALERNKLMEDLNKKMIEDMKIKMGYKV